MRRFRNVILRLLPLADLGLFLFVYPAAALLKLVRKAGVHRMPMCKRALLNVGVFPIRDHYYEPLIDTRGLRSLTEPRVLPGIDWNVDEQLALISSFDHVDEIAAVFRDWKGTPVFHFQNDAIEAGDAEIWYSYIRSRKPRTIIEIGSGFSTMLAAKAIEMNRRDDPAYSCRHVCIEPYEAPWLESSGVTVIRQKVEDVSAELFGTLYVNDVLFIDSSHVIRPQGDVLTEFLTILPTLKPGVVVHVHDVFSPRDYPEAWVKERVLFWNEQYLLESFLSHNCDWKILAALNYLHHDHYDVLKSKCPFLTPEHEPGSFYLQRAN